MPTEKEWNDAFRRLNKGDTSTRKEADRLDVSPSTVSRNYRKYLERKVSDAESKLEKVREEVQGKGKELEELEEEKGKEKEELEETREKVEELRNITEDRGYELEEAIDELEKIDNLEETNEDLKRNQKDLEKHKEKLEDRASSLKDDIEGLESLKDLHGRTEEKKSELGILDEATSAKKKKDQLQEETATLDEEKSRLISESKKLRRKDDRISQSIKKRKADFCDWIENTAEPTIEDVQEMGGDALVKFVERTISESNLKQKCPECGEWNSSEEIKDQLDSEKIRELVTEGETRVLCTHCEGRMRGPLGRDLAGAEVIADGLNIDIKKTPVKISIKFEDLQVPGLANPLSE